MKNLIKFLAYKAYNLRRNSIISTTEAGSGHPTSCLSAADLVSTIFFYAMIYDPNNIKNYNNDRFILSKGHAAPLLYAVWKELGILTEGDILNLRKFNSNLEGHPSPRFPQADASTGSLGCGLSIGAGMALSAKLDNLSFTTYVLLGDSEMAEGSIWEAMQISSFYKLNNLIAVLDCNRLGQSTQTMEGYDTKNYERKFKAFGWKTFIIDGHNIEEIVRALTSAKLVKDKPSIIIAKTIKGCGIPSVENRQGFHGKVFKKNELTKILKELKDHFQSAATFKVTKKWKPNKPRSAINKRGKCKKIKLPTPNYKLGDQIPTRKVYGETIALLGDICKQVISLDAEVKNSTFAEIFERKHPSRFFQCFIAEQNMVGMGVGLYLRGKIPFISTFGAFFTRAYDQIRMASIGDANLKLSGSHAGVSIGEDGPSQMALEDISIMRAVNNSVVLYPCDAVSTYKLIEQMANFNKGIAYIRTTRAATPTIYSNIETFKIGGCKIIKKSNRDKACLITAGITLFEALKAYDILNKQGINISIIDLYSIKPMDSKTLKKMGLKSNNLIITVEDHYIQGGIGEAVSYELRNYGIRIECLAVRQKPKSGSMEKLLEYEKIDANSIIKKLKEII